MKKLSIRVKLIVLAGLAVFTLLAVGGFSVWQASRLHAQLETSIATQSRLLGAVDGARSAQVAFKIQVQEWKNILLRGKDPENFDKYLAGFDAREKEVFERLAQLKALVDELPMADRLKVDETIAEFRKLGPAYREALKYYDRSEADPASVVDRRVKGLDRQPSALIDALVGEIRKAADETAAREEAAAQANYDAVRLWLSVFLGGAVLIMAALAWFVIASITRPVAQLKKVMTLIASSSDLTQRAADDGKDEIGTMATAFNAMIAGMQSLVAQVASSVQAVNSAAGSMAQTADGLSAAADEQSRSVAGDAASIEELTVAIAAVADTADEVRRQSLQSVANSSDGSRKVGELVSEIHRIEATVADIAKSVEDFVRSTSAITGMTREVREIADQTNLLALNAAIEAARAGEAGRGFAVVADEVRKLAEKSGRSALDIDEVARSIMQQTREVRAAIDAGLKSIEVSTGIAVEVERTLDQARQSVDNASRGVEEIASSVSEQKAASTEIARNTERIANSAEETSAASVRMSASASQLRDAAADLRQSIAGFRV
jgi:methyl-accepting chemotaxis protein